MRYLNITLLLLLCTSFSFAQKQGNAWYFGEFAGLSFNSGAPVAVTNGQLTTNEGCASIADKKTGNVLFYTDGTSVWDRNNTQMPNGTSGLGGNSSSTQSGVIVPIPGSDSLYYIFTVDAQAGIYGGSSGGANYNIVNMSLNGGLGDVSTKFQVMLTPTTEKIAATASCDGKNIWVVIHQWNSNAFYAYLITKTGISAPVITNIGITHQDIGSGDNAEAIGYMKISPDGTKLALVCYEQLNTMQLFDFNNTTGVVSNAITDTGFPNISGEDGPYGLSFSPDNSKLYVGYFAITPNPSEIYQYNLQAGNAAAIVASRVSVGTSDVDAFGALQNGPDGKMYVARYGNDSLDAIENPNALGTACNYVTDAVYLGGAGNICTFGLPDIIENFLTPQYKANLSYLNCNTTETVQIVDSNLTGTITSMWNFGDPNSGTADTSTLASPTHDFSGNGTYTVTVVLTSPCQGSDTIKKTVTIKPSPIIKISPLKPVVCSGEAVTLVANGAVSYQWSPSGGLSATSGSSVSANPSDSTTYIVIGTDSAGCTARDTVTVNIGTQPTASFSMSEPNSCSPNQVQFTNTSTNDSTFVWIFGDGTTSTEKNPLHTYPTANKYTITLIVKSSNGCIDSTKQTESIITAEDFALIPSAFTPSNTASLNATFYPNVQCTDVNGYEFRVYNRWGNKVFESSNPNIGWDGKYNGTLLPLDVYVYYVTFDCGICKVSKKGDVTLIR